MRYKNLIRYLALYYIVSALFCINSINCQSSSSNNIGSYYGKTFSLDLLSPDPNINYIPNMLTSQISSDVQDPYLLARNVYCATMQLSGYFGDSCILPTNTTMVTPFSSYTSNTLSYAQQYMIDISDYTPSYITTSTIIGTQNNLITTSNNTILTTNDGRILDIDTIPSNTRVQYTINDLGAGVFTQGAISVPSAVIVSNVLNTFPKMPSSNTGFEYGPSSYEFCDGQILDELSVNSSSLTLKGSATMTSSTRNITLTRYYQYNTTGAVWFNQAIDVNGGFKVNFALEFLNSACTNPSTKVYSCSASNRSCPNSPIYECGGEGVAFVVQSVGPNATGDGNTQGLGYSGIQNVLALEFDPVYTSSLGDPATSQERHISLIVRQGIAQANEKDSVVWNSNPLNFKLSVAGSQNSENFVTQPWIKIEYYNRYLRVYVNNMLQLGYYWAVDLQQYMGTPTSYFWIGFTGSTSSIAQTQNILNLNIFVVDPVAITSYAAIYYPNNLDQETADNYMVTGNPFYMYVTVTDACANMWTTTDLTRLSFSDDANYNSISSGACQINSISLNTEQSIEANFKIQITCNQTGVNAINVLWDGIEIDNMPILWNTRPGPPVNGTISFANILNGNPLIGLGTTDTLFYFTIQLYDQFNNPTNLMNPFTIQDSLSVSWPDPADTNSSNVFVYPDNTYPQYYGVVIASKAGYYNISFSYSTNNYQFYIKTGQPSPTNSSAYFIDQNGNFISNLTVVAGLQTIYLQYLVYDIGGNTIPVTTNNTWSGNLGLNSSSSTPQVAFQVYQSVSNNQIGYQLLKIINSTAVFNFTPTTKGSNHFTPLLNSIPVNCPKCDVVVLPGPYSLTNSEIWAYDPNAKQYAAPNTYPLLWKSGNLQILLMLKDQYMNYLNNVPLNFILTLAGNNMQPMTLCSSLYQSGILFSTCNSSQDYQWQHLVGRQNYTITITELNTTNSIQFYAQIVSDGSDIDAGNGNMDYTKTTWWPYKGPSTINAGQSYSFIVQLKQNQSMRYNDWINSSRITLGISNQASSDTWSISSIWNWGYYLIQFQTTSARPLVIFSLFIDNVNLTNAGTYNLQIVPGIPTLAVINSAYLLPGTFNFSNTYNVENPLNFVVTVTDQYGNLATSSPSLIDVTASIQSANIRIKPIISFSSTSPGNYSCSFNIPFAGNYSITSMLFNSNNTQYYVSVQPGYPTTTNSLARLLFNISSKTNINATTVIQFLITPRDKYSNLIPPQYFLDGNNFTLSYRDPKSGQSIPITNVVLYNDSISIVYTVQLNTTGSTTFYPLLKGQAVSCSICNVLVSPSYAVWNNSVVQLISNSKTTTLSSSSSIMLDNYNSQPTFYLRMADVANNIMTIPGDWNTFQAWINCTGNSSQYNFTLYPAIAPGGIMFGFLANDPQITNFMNIIYSNDWQLIFSASRLSTAFYQIYPLVQFLGQGLQDNGYDNAAISPLYSYVTPSTLSMIAGQPSSVILTLLTVNHKIQKSWYNTITNNIVLNVSPSASMTYTINYGSGKGTYLISFSGTISQNYAISFQVNINGTMVLLSTQLAIQVSPAALSYIQLFSNSLGGNNIFNPISVDNTLQFAVIPKDTYGNIIYFSSQSAFGITITNLTNQALYTLTANMNTTGIFNYTLNSQKIGTLRLTSYGFRDTMLNIIQYYDINFIAGYPSATQSISMLNITEISAGNSIKIMIFPKDQYQNPINITSAQLNDTLWSLNHNSPSSQSSINMGLPFTSLDGSSFYWISSILTTSGTHVFQPSFQGQNIKISNPNLIVNPLTPVFQNLTINILNPSTLTETTYNPQTGFVLTVTSSPTFIVHLSDAYGNQITQIPSTWNLQVSLQNSGGYIAPLLFCSNGNRYSICPQDNSTWSSLVGGNGNFNIEVTMGQQTLIYAVTLTNTQDNEDVSILPINVQNTILTPVQPQISAAGDTIQFNVELRTLDASLRPNTWFNNPQNNISIQIGGMNAGIDFNYTVTYGDKTGIYVVLLNVYRATQSNTSAIMTLFVNNIEFMNTTPSLTITQGPISSVLPIGANQTAFTLPSSTVDSSYVITMMAFDSFNNTLQNIQNSMNLGIIDPNGNNLAYSSITASKSGLYTMSFTPTIAGIYIFNTGYINYTINLTPGAPSVSTSFSTLTTNLTLAGQLIVLNVQLQDQFGNTISLNNSLAQSLTATYQGQLSSSSYVVTSGLISGNQYQFMINITKADTYTFTASYKNAALSCQACMITVAPNTIAFTQSHLLYLDSSSNSFEVFPAYNPLKEDNRNTIPVYQLNLADSFGNIYTVTPNIINGLIIDLANDTEIDYEANYTMNAIYITIANNTLTSYENLLYSTSTYLLTLTYQNITINYQIIMLGDGLEDLSADTSALNASATYASSTNLQSIAGESTQFYIELRTINNLRKSNAPYAVVTLDFSIYDPSNNYTIMPGDLSGRYIIFITTNKTYSQVDNQFITILINGSAGAITPQLQVSPSTVSQAVVLTNLSNTQTTDNIYLIEIMPLDAYGNNASCDPQTANVQFIFPNNVAVSYTSLVDSQTGIISYQLSTTVVGTYVMISNLFEQQLQNFIVIAGQPNPTTSFAQLSTNITTSNSTIRLFITPYDANYNIIPSGTNNILNQFTVEVNTNGQNIPINTNFQWSTISQNTIEVDLNFTVAGSYSIQAFLGNDLLSCQNCNLNITAGNIYITNTQFLVSNGGLNYYEVNYAIVTAGTSSLNLQALIFDYWNNQITLSSVLLNSFSAILTGNNMNPMTLNINMTSQGLSISVPQTLSTNFSYLVPGNYSLSLNYLGNSDNFTVMIQGNSTDAGNGDFINSMTYINPAFLQMVAGQSSQIMLELRTSQNLRYNGDFNYSQSLSLQEVVTEGTFNISLFNTGVKNRFIFSLYTTKAYTFQNPKIFQVMLNGQPLNQEIMIVVTPNSPNINNTVLIQSFNSTSMTDQMVTILFELFDSYGNQYTNTSILKNMSSTVLSGSADISKNISLENGTAFAIFVDPHYPPAQLTIDVLYFDVIQNATISLFTQPLSTTLETQLAPSRTQIIYSQSNGIISVAQNFSFNIILKDNKGYCYVDTEQVFVSILGPYTTSNIYDPTQNNPTLLNYTLQAVPFTPSSSVQVGSYSCQIMYEVSLQEGSLYLSGYYQINIIISGQNNNNPVIQARDTYVQPGATYPLNSQLSFINRPLLGSAPMTLSVGNSLTFLLSTFDIYGNQILTDNSNNVTITMNSDSSNILITNLHNGSYAVQITLTTTGVYNLKASLSISIDNSSLFTPSDLPSLLNFPSTVTVVPGPCSLTNPSISVANTTIYTGQQINIVLQCMDQYGNNLTSGGANFQANIQGFNLDIVGSDKLPLTIIDLNTGAYNITFITAYQGTYQAQIFLNGILYGSSITFQSYWSLCSNSTLTCPASSQNPGMCANTYLECGFPYVSAICSTIAPIYCSVNGAPTCVKGRYLCDCPANMIKCSSDNKCVSDISLCTTASMMTIQCFLSDYPYLCPDGTCKSDANACSSQPVCPPGYILCGDQSCISELDSCPTFSACSPSAYYKCPDQSCATSINECPSTVSCGDPNLVLCPDGTCVLNELQCRQPQSCPQGQYLCLPDYSCVNDLSQCPSKISCQYLALCSDGSCRSDCSVLNSIQPVINTRLRILQNDTESSSCPSDYIICPGSQQCVRSSILCPTVPACGPNTVKCPDGSCLSDLSQCSSLTCSEDTIKCWDGTCQTDISFCPTQITCPPTLPILCHDGSCVQTIANCPDYIPCPSFAPYRCATGECRIGPNQCPTLISCPENLPVMCPDSSCRTTKFHCENAAVLTACSSNMIKCPDGSCAWSMELCPTMISCARGNIRCWDGSCVINLNLCPPTIQVCSDDQIRCPDGTCVTDVANCPTRIICPIDLPILCDDGNCRKSTAQCTNNTSCSPGLQLCPDGTCVLKQCGTSITCPSTAPYKCFDSTCKKNPNDCNTAPLCSGNTPFLCPDGSCVSLRVDCKPQSACSDPTKPVKCPDLNCYSSASLCTQISGCPQGFMQCSDGSCATSQDNCLSQNCPIYLPYMCLDGFCVSNLTFCDNNITGCPYYKPYKCPDGTCVLDNSTCSNYNATCPDPSISILCPDGSCVMYESQCNLANGCPPSTPLKCSDGLCIDPTKTTCSVATCPNSAPIKCIDGLCVTTSAYCISAIDLYANSQCTNDPSGNTVPCADGRCVASSDQCRPVYACQPGYQRCNDGSCRLLISLCPLTTQGCPEEMPFRCDIGACAVNSTGCPSSNGCPWSHSMKCQLTGECVSDAEECLDQESQVTTTNSRILASTNNSNSSQGAYLCPNGTYSNNLTDCLSVGITCPEGNFICPDNTCKPSFNDCKTTNGCPVTQPYLCADGTCASTPSNIPSEVNSCQPTIQCPAYKPYLCGNGECVGDLDFCKVLLPCPPSTPLRCPDKTCIDVLSNCPSTNLCPITSPILCSNGICASSVQECPNNVNQACTTDKPILCASGICVESASICVYGQIFIGQSRRLLNDLALPSTNNCPSDTPIQCYDGSCRSNSVNCPIFSGCPNPSAPYKCSTGVCVSDSSQCPTATNCQSGMQLCEDGLCRATCLPFNGCPLETPMQCPNGYCSVDLGGCAGESACPSDTPFRCSNNQCVAMATLCQRPIKTYQPETISLTISPFTDSTIEFIKDPETQLEYATLTIPPGAFVKSQNNSNVNTSLSLFLVTSVADSVLMGLTNPINSSLMDYTAQIFPLSDGVLPYHLAVRSPVVSFDFLDGEETEYNFSPILQIQADVAINSNYSSDYCLGRANLTNNSWQCVQNQMIALSTNNNNNNTFGFYVPKDGIYAVLFNPTSSNGAQNSELCNNWACQNKKLLALIIILSVLGLGIMIYGFCRVYRYIGKYKWQKERLANMRAKLNEMQQTKTQQLGQNLRDRIEGITFMINPLYENLRKKSRENQRQELTELEMKQKRLNTRETILSTTNNELNNKNIELSRELLRLKNELTSQIQKKEEVEEVEEQTEATVTFDFE